MGRMDGKVAAITGGNSGIGLAIAKAFHAEGAKVGILGRDPATLESATKAIGEGTVAVRGDVTNPASLDELYTETVGRHGMIDVLVANAGVADPRPFEQVDERFFDTVCGINFKGCFFTVQRALESLNKDASVILVGSVLAQKGFPGMAVYNATKAAVRNLGRTLAAELQPRGVRVNVLSPGPIETPIYERMEMSDEDRQAFADQILQQVPLGRFGTAEEVARAALFLATEESAYMTGADLQADGGFTQV